MALPLLIPLLAGALGVGLNVREGKRARTGRAAEAGLMAQAAQGGDLSQLLASPRKDTVDFAQDELNRRAEAERTAPTRDLDFKIREGELRRNNIAENMAELQFEQAGGQGLAPERLIQTADMLFDDRQKELQPFKDSLASFDQLMSVIDSETGPASFAQLFKFIKSMDDSVVRSSEGDLLTGSTGPIRLLANAFNQARGKGFFDQQTRDEIKQAASQLAESSFDTARKISTDHDTRAARFAEQFQTPALRGLSQGVGFDPGRTFDPVNVRQRGERDEIVDPALLPEGVTQVR